MDLRLDAFVVSFALVAAAQDEERLGGLQLPPTQPRHLAMPEHADAEERVRDAVLRHALGRDEAHELVPAEHRVGAPARLCVAHLPELAPRTLSI
jgi:hypothetical protein